jgi:hypothetical protein
LDWDPRPAVCDQAELAALDPANLSFMWEVSEFSADFLESGHIVVKFCYRRHKVVK